MKETVVAGGSYLIDGVQCTGLAFGLDRLQKLAKIEMDNLQCLIVNIKQDRDAIKLGEFLRDNGLRTIVLDKISKGLEYANKMGIPYVVFAGSDEVKNKKFKLKDMKSGKEDLLKREDLIKRMK